MFLKNELDGNLFTGYFKKGNYYYKTRKKGNAVNVRAGIVHNLFSEELTKYQIDKSNIPMLEKEVHKIVSLKLEQELQASQIRKRKIKDLENKMEKLELRFVESEITKELFEKYTAQYQREKEELLSEIGKSDFESSNFEKIIKKAIEISRNPLQLWHSIDYDDKQRLQFLMFPEGLMYNKENNTVRTFRVNNVFSLIASTARVVDENKKGNLKKDYLNSHLVERTGIEPVIPP